jgi:carbon monoxide dehydrogenase subunit G
MRIVTRVLIGIVVLVVALVAVGFVLPRHGHVERSIEIKAPQAQVFDMLNSFKRFNEFSPWAELDPALQYTYEGPDQGVGARMSWSSAKEDVGSGSNEIVESVSPNLVRTRVLFEGMPSEASFRLEPAGEDTRVTWSFDADFGANPAMRYFGLMLDGFVGPDYEKGLAKLKQVMELENAG